MPTDKPRVTFTVNKDTLDKIDEFRFSNKSKNQTQAILSLIEKGLSDLEPERKKAPSISDEARKAAKDYDSLDHHGKRVVRLVLDEELRRMDEQKPLEIAARTGVSLKRSDDLDSIPLIGEDSEVP